jgi:hypothetical protein
MAKERDREFLLGAHLDFKGVMFKPGYLPTLIDDLASQGVNAVLVEYETTFPFEGMDVSDDPATVLKLSDIKKLNSRAAARGMQVIPLVQCLGHLEYVLNKRKYRNLAIPHKFYDTIDPTNPKAVGLVVEMLEQVVAAHQAGGGVTHVHLGMDEATSLTHLAKEMGRDVLELFCEHLEAMLKVVEGKGLKAIIWADMIQDFYKPGLFDRFKGRVILSPWEYGSVGDVPHTHARLGGGTRVDKRWRGEPLNAQSPVITQHTRYFQDMSEGVREAIAPYRVGERHVLRHFYLDLFVEQGFTCLPGSAVRVSGNGAILPPVNQLVRQQESWAGAVKRVRGAEGGGGGAMGHIATSWARGRTFKPPNFMFDLTWWLIHEAARLLGREPEAFWPDLEEGEVRGVMEEIGRVREDWRIEGQIIARMGEMGKRVKRHAYEWKSLVLMVETLRATRQAEGFLAEGVSIFNAPRLVPSDVDRREQEFAEAAANLAEVRGRVRKHFARRYHGLALEEWERFVFEKLALDLEVARKRCAGMKARCRAFWG